jgi:FAD/FMN-containing dehydrogenase
MATRTFEIAGRDGSSVAVGARQLEHLSSRIDGPLLTAGDEGWDEAVRIWNGMVAKVPALVVQPTSSQDVAAAVDFARDQGVLLSVKGGGHNIAGTAIAEGGLTLEMSRMRSVKVDPDARLVNVGPGCLLGDVDAATQEHGLATVLGFMSETGVAGLTLGGGWGFLARRFGFAVDNLEEVEIVTADGKIRTANRQENADLFWAVRGGGGNFGIVTRFTFRLHEVGPTVTGGLIGWPVERAEQVLSTYRELTESAPRELTAALAIRLAPPAPFVPQQFHFKPVVTMLVCHSGPNPEKDLEPIRALGEPGVDTIAEKPYTEQQSMINPMEPSGPHRYWKTEFFPKLDDGFLEAFRENAAGTPSPLSYGIVFHLAGALNEHDEDDGAVGNRDAHYVGGFAGVWMPGASGSDEIAWTRKGWEAIRPYSTGGNYVNFQLAEDGVERTADAYGGNFARLQKVKAAYDPDNVFRVNRNISPST